MLLSAIFSVFGTVADVVAGLALVPLVTWVNILVDLVISVASGILTKLGNICLELFAYNPLNIENGRSIFEMIFKSVSDLSSWICYCAFALLLLLYIYQMVKIMTTADVRETSPIELTFKTFIAGFLIFNGKTVIIEIAKVFDLFYQYLLGNRTSGSLDFLLLGQKARLVMADDSIMTAISYTGQLRALVGSAILLGLILLIGVRLVRFTMEFVQRYSLLHILIFTTPLAFVLAPFKSFSESFNKWFRLIISQLLILTLEVFCLRLFIDAFSHCTTALSDLNTLRTSGFVTVVLWSMMLYAILYVGGRLDNYIKALGITSPIMGDALLSAVIGETREFLSEHKGPSLSFSGMRSSIMESKTSRETKRTNRSIKEGAYQFEKDPVTNVPTSDSISKVLAVDGITMSGAMFGRGIIGAMKGMPTKYSSALDYTTAELSENGVITMSSFANKNGERMRLQFVPTDKYPTTTETGRRLVKIGNKRYAVNAEGEGADRFMAYNPKLAKDLEQNGVSPKNLNYDSETGIYTETEETSHGKAFEKYYIPLSLYPKGNPLMEPFSTYEEHNGIMYQIATIPTAYLDRSEKYSTMDGDISISGSEYGEIKNATKAEQAQWVYSQLPTLRDKEIDHVYWLNELRNGFMYESANQEKHLVRPISSAFTQDSELAERAEIHTARNGTVYVDINYGQDENHQLELDAKNSFEDAIQAAKKTGFVTPNSEANRGFRNNIVRTARQKNASNETYRKR